MILNKSLPIILIIFAISVGYIKNETNVAENSPSTFSLSNFIFEGSSKIALWLDWLNVAPEYSTFRTLLHWFSWSSIDKSDQSVKVTNRKINNLNVRIYTPNIKTDSPLPLMIYIHGGAYVFGTLNDYDLYLFKIAKKSNISVLSIDYRLAPEYPFPTPTNDCWSVIEYILQNPSELNVNLSKLMLAGDSAGGNAAMVMSKRLALEKNVKPIFQVLIYPWSNLATFQIPSTFKYRDFSDSSISGSKLILWYMGIKKVTNEMIETLVANNHTLLLDDAQKEKFSSYLNISLIPDEYKTNRSYYETYKYLQPIKTGAKLANSSILLRDKNFANITKSLFSEDVSPGLSDLDRLKLQPKTYEIVCEIDDIKDDGLLLSQRLRQAGVEVKVAFYEKCYHGSVTQVSEKDSLSLKILDDLVTFIKNNI